jgi:hypothetical protein
MCRVCALASVMGMRVHVTSPIALVCLALLFFFARGHAVPAAPAPAVSVAVSPPITWEQADRLDTSGDDLFWTATRRFRSGVTLATVHRAHGDAVTVVYRELGVSFGDVADGRFVVVNDYLRGVSRIKRFDQGGTLATSERLIGRRDLLTDGTALYWADEAGVHTVAVGGGAVRTLARSAAVRFVALDGDRLYFAAGNVVRSVGTGGGPVRTEVVGQETVTALAVQRGELYWSELGAGIRQRGGFFRSAVPGRVVTELSVAATRVLWVDCSAAGSDCLVRAYAGGGISGFEAGAGAHDVQDDGVRVVYAGPGGVTRHVLSGPRQSRIG